MFKDFIFRLPSFKNNPSSIITSICLLPVVFKNEKEIINNLCKSMVVLATYPIQKNKKISIDKHEGILTNFNLMFLTLNKKNSVLYVPTYKLYNSVFEIYK